MRFDTYMLSESSVTVVVEERPIAIFDLDYLYQLNCVTLFETFSSPEERLATLRLASWHAQQYIVRREFQAFGGIMTGQIGSGLSDLPQSLETLEMTDIPVATIPVDYGTLIDNLNSMRIPVIPAIHLGFMAALDHVIYDSALPPSISYEIVRHESYDSLVRVRFTVEAPNKFRFWKTVSRDLYVIPSYHPEMQGRHYSYLINGDTDALIRGNSVRSVYTPLGSNVIEDDNFLSSSWARMKHPVLAEGQSFEASISIRHILSEEGTANLVALLAAALELDSSYVGISGGFRSPYAHPANVVRQYGIRPTRGEVRGSEGHCAWIYYTLQAEGFLEGSHVPDWFLGEGWLNAYPSLSETPASH